VTDGWTLTRLGNLLVPVQRAEGVDPAKQYRLLGVRLDGRGPFIRETKLGSQIAAKSLFRICAGDFIYSRLFAWRGAFGLINDSMVGCYVSGEFPAFVVDREQADPQFLLLWFRLRGTLERVESLCSGSTPLTRNRFKEHFFLDMSIPLPPLDEQRRIVTRIEELAAKIEDARGLRREVDEQYAAVISAKEMSIWPQESLESAPCLAEVTTYLSRGRQSRQGTSEHLLIKTQHVQMGRYVPTSMTLSADAAAKVHDDARVRPNDVLIACSAAGCLGRVALYEHGQHTASTDTHVAIARADERAVDPRYLYHYLRGAQGQHQLRSRERGDWQREKVGFRLTELNLADLKQVPVPIPSLERQRSTVQYLDGLYDKIDKTTWSAAAIDRELVALMPAMLSAAVDGKL